MAQGRRTLGGPYVNALEQGPCLLKELSVTNTARPSAPPNSTASRPFLKVFERAFAKGLAKDFVSFVGQPVLEMEARDQHQGH